VRQGTPDGWKVSYRDMVGRSVTIASDAIYRAFRVMRRVLWHA
jgi:hypothetical protein